jgi:redox-sensitive bicupin YhaK (pirin superfamily)
MPNRPVIRPVKRLINAIPTLEGADVHLRRAFGFGDTPEFDPFLLLDDFRNDVPDDYLAGSPWHPHRGIETVTYVQAGEDGIRFLLISGKPLEEPVAWYGPIVMNTQDQLRKAFEDLDRGTFLKV